MAQTTSGTVSSVVYPIQKIIEKGFRRAGVLPQNISGEDMQVAMDLLYTLSSELVNAGFPLWTRTYVLGQPAVGSPELAMPQGTLDILHAYWRILMPYRGPCTVNGGANNTLFGGQPNADVVISGPDPSVTVTFGTATEVDTVGVLSGGNTTFTAALQIYTSADGQIFTLAQTLPSAIYAPGTWTYFDLDPTLSPYAMQIVNPTSGSWTVNQIQFALANGQDIEIGPLNIDDYYNLPDKMFQGDRVISSYTDRQLEVPVLKCWPTLNLNGFYNGCVTSLNRRYMQDPGTPNDLLEVPQRWLEAIQWRLASRLIREVPEGGSKADPTQTSYLSVIARQQRLQDVDQQAARSEALAWGEERSRGPIRLTPDLSVYTR